MAKLNYQDVSRHNSLKNKPMIGDQHDSRSHVDLNLPVKLNGPDYVIKYGPHKGTMLKDLPLDYIISSIMRINDSRVDMFVRELQRRDPSMR